MLLRSLLLTAVTAIVVANPSSARAGERSYPLGPAWLESGLYAGKLTGEVEDCFCPEQLVIGVQITRFFKLGFSRTKMPLVADERDEELRVRRYGAMAMFVFPF